MGSRTIEHLKSQNTDIARRSSRAKPDGAAPIMRGMKSRTDGAYPTSSSTSSKSFAVPKITSGMKSDPERGSYDPSLAGRLFAEAVRSADDFAQDLHATSPPKTPEG
jgi:hypothetical protein